MVNAIKNLTASDWIKIIVLISTLLFSYSRIVWEIQSVHIMMDRHIVEGSKIQEVYEQDRRITTKELHSMGIHIAKMQSDLQHMKTDVDQINDWMSE